jgi:hypothetical protein
METTSATVERPATQKTPGPLQRLRVWPTALALIFLSPIVGEMISGSTPPLLFVQPFFLVFLPTMYGAWALLTHEVLVQRRLGWGNALLLGAAFGVFQEALVVQTWFNYISPQSPSHMGGTYGLVAGTSLNWALNLTIYHAVVSITVPLILIAVFFPRRAPLPWLGPKRIVLVTAWMQLLCGALAVNATFNQFVAAGYSGPPLISYLLAAAFMLLLIVLGVFVRFPMPRPNPAKRAPRLWTVRLICAGYMILFFAFSVILPATGMPAVAAMALMLLLFASALWRVRSWSARAGWNERHLLSIAIGVILYFTLVWGPLIEFIGHLPARTGMTVVNLLIVVVLLIFDQRLKRRLARQAQAEATPLPAEFTAPVA